MKQAKIAALSWLACLAFCMAGCGGEFILTTPDTVGQAGQDVPVAVRLQRREFWKLVLPNADAALCFCMPDGSFKAARTDKHGYASVTFPAPEKPGRYDICVSHQNPKGDTCQGSLLMYVLASGKPLAVVDLDSLPGSSKDSAAAADALNRIRERVEILYITDKLASEPAAAHDFLARLHYPDSAVIPAFTKRDWLRKYEMRTLPSMIVLLKSRLGDLRYGITSDADMAKAMQQAALELIFVGKGAPRGVFGVQDFGHLELPLAQQPGGPMPPISSQPAE